MDGIVDDLAGQHAELDGLIGSLDEDGWARPSACEGWSVADVVLHLAQTDDLALASLRGRFADVIAELARGLPAGADIDAAADLAVARERGGPGSQVGGRWRDTARSLCDELRAADPHRRVAWVTGELSVRTLAVTRLAEAWIHTADVAAALGVSPAPTGRLREVARLAWRTLPYAFSRAGRALSGPVAFDLRGPDGDRWVFEPASAAATTVRGEGAELCAVAARRVAPADTSLRAEGPDAEAVLALVRTYA